jgi:hypothetical protein
MAYFEHHDATIATQTVLTDTQAYERLSAASFDSFIPEQPELSDSSVAERFELIAAGIGELSLGDTALQVQ